MSHAHRREVTSFLLAVVVHFYTFSVCHSVNLGHREHDFTAYQLQVSAAAQRESVHQEQAAQRGNLREAERVTRSPNLPGPDEPRPQPAALRGETLPHASVPKLVEIDRNFTLHSLFWTAGNINKHPLPSTPDLEDGYQADFTGFEGVQGKVLGPSFDSTHFSQWLAIRPFVQCDDHVMTFTASGLGFTQLLVDREGASPISLFQLPSSCGYTVRTSWSDLEMMAPYDACYITQENGSYVLPMLWWGSPLKLSCPVRVATPSPSLPPSVFCSSYGMAVQIHGQEQDVGMLGVKVNGAWRPFVSEECAYRVHSRHEELNFFISYFAPCVTSGDGLQIQLISTGHQYILSCPVHLYIPSSPLSPSDPQFPYIPHPVGPEPTSPPPPLPQPPIQEQITQRHGYPHYPYPGLQYPQLPQVYPPGPQASHPPQPTPGSPPGPQPQQPQQPQQQQSVYPIGLGMLTYSPADHTEYPHQSYGVVQTQSSLDLSQVQDNSFYQGSKLHVSSSQHLSSLTYPYIPLHYPAVTPAPTPAAKGTTTTSTQPPKLPESAYYPHYSPQMPYYPAFTATPVIQAPVSVPPDPPSPSPSPPKQPVDPQYPVNPFYSPTSFGSYYYYGDFFYPNSVPVVPASTSHPTVAPPSSPTTTTSTGTTVDKQPSSPSHPFGHFYPQRPIYLTPPTHLPPAKDKQPQTIPQELQKQVVPQVTCPPNSQTICGYYPHPYPYNHPLYPPQYHPPYLPVPQYPQTQPPVTIKKPHTTTTATTSTPTTPTRPSPQKARLQCLNGRMVVFLPFAHPESIQVRDHMKTWLFLSGVSPLCGYVVQMAEDSWVILHSPLPACHSEPRTPTAISLPLRFWDLSMAQYRTLELQCPHQTPPSVSPSVAPPSTTRQGKVIPRVVSKPEVFCSSNQMAVALPSGPISGIVLKDIKGNQMNFQDAPKHCGYSAKKGKDGKINLTLQLHSDCLMGVQGKMYIITVIYMTVNGKREAQLFCPHLSPGSGQECNLSSKQRLPCGPDSVSQPQCLSMGCCFSKQPPACYYPMDECTIDRHFVFSVPATLTEPPLSPALLVTAGNPACKPQRVTSDYALFRIPMNGCGTRRVMMGKTVIYMVEVINQVQAVSLGYGTITRDSPVRLLVECRYLPSAVLTVSYMVKTPSLGPAIQTHGVFGVQLRIAKDAQYSSYYPQYHQPLEMLLGKPLYLEVRLLNTPDPNLVLLVHYCVAYPRSGKAVWLLLYNGCPNPLDPAPQQAVVVNPPPPAPQAQTRRFTITTFQFLPDGEFKDPEEEIYFMCSTEICSPRDGPCVEGCFGQ